jgi:hypothetical protein
MRRGLLATALSMGLLVVPPASALADTLDQQQTQTGGFVATTESCIPPNPTCVDVSHAETFTAGLSGAVDRVDLVLDRSNATTAPLTVEIRTVTSGCPSATVLASTQVAAADVPVATGPTPPFDAITFPNPAPVAAGSQYVVVFYTASGNDYLGYGSTADPYSGGQACSSFSTPPSTWGAEANLDFAFKTYVGPLPPPPPPPPSTATGQRAAALASCKKRAHKHGWSHKRLKKCKRKANLLPI